MKAKTASSPATSLSSSFEPLPVSSCPSLVSLLNFRLSVYGPRPTEAGDSANLLAGLSSRLSELAPTLSWTTTCLD